jgi:hypothetical protein
VVDGDLLDCEIEEISREIIKDFGKNALTLQDFEKVLISSVFLLKIVFLLRFSNKTDIFKTLLNLFVFQFVKINRSIFFLKKLFIY